MIRKYKNRQLPKGIFVSKDGLVYICIFNKCKKFRQSFGPVNPSSLNVAIAKLATYREEIVNDRFSLQQKSKRIHFSDAVDLFLSHTPVESYKFLFNGLRKFIGDDTLYDELTHIKMEGYRNWCKLNRTVKVLNSVRPITDSTINRELGALGAMYYWFKKQSDAKTIEPLKIPEVTPCKDVEMFDERLARRTRVLSTDEFQQFMFVATPRVNRIVMGALNTALRKCDLLALKQDNLVTFADELHGEQSKTGKPFIVPANDNVKLLFNTNSETIFDDTNFRREFEASRNRFIKKTGSPHFQFRDLRRTALRKVWEGSKNIMLCRDLAGHTDVGTTQRYLGLTSTETRMGGDILMKGFSQVTTDSKLSRKLSDEEKHIGFKPDKKDDNQ